MNTTNGFGGAFGKNNRMNVQFRLTQSDSWKKKTTTTETSDVKKVQNNFNDRVAQLIEKMNHLHTDLKEQIQATQSLKQAIGRVREEQLIRRIEETKRCLGSKIQTLSSEVDEGIMRHKQRAFNISMNCNALNEQKCNLADKASVLTQRVEALENTLGFYGIKEKLR